MSINQRELKAIHLILQCFPYLTNMIVKSYINRHRGTCSLLLNSLVTTIWEQCLTHNLHIQAQHIARIDNVQADNASRHFHLKNHWQLLQTTFRYTGALTTLIYLWIGPTSSFLNMCPRSQNRKLQQPIPSACLRPCLRPLSYKSYRKFNSRASQ